MTQVRQPYHTQPVAVPPRLQWLSDLTAEDPNVLGLLQSLGSVEELGVNKALSTYCSIKQGNVNATVVVVNGQVALKKVLDNMHEGWVIAQLVRHGKCIQLMGAVASSGGHHGIIVNRDLEDGNNTDIPVPVGSKGSQAGHSIPHCVLEPKPLCCRACQHSVHTMNATCIAPRPRYSMRLLCLEFTQSTWLARCKCL